MDRAQKIDQKIDQRTDQRTDLKILDLALTIEALGQRAADLVMCNLVMLHRVAEVRVRRPPKVAFVQRNNSLRRSSARNKRGQRVQARKPRDQVVPLVRKAANRATAPHENVGAAGEKAAARIQAPRLLRWGRSLRKTSLKNLNRFF